MALSLDQTLSSDITSKGFLSRKSLMQEVKENNPLTANIINNFKLFIFYSLKSDINTNIPYSQLRIKDTVAAWSFRVTERQVVEGQQVVS